MLRYGLIVLLLFGTTAVLAHPHAWVDAQYQIQVDEPTIQTLRGHWSLDVFTTTSLVEDYDNNGDGQFTGEERTKLLTALHRFDQFGYFVHLKVDGNVIQPKHIDITDFGVKDNMMWMTLKIDLAHPVNLEKHTLSLAFGDDTYFFALVPLEEGLVDLSGKLAELCTSIPRDATERGIETWVDLTCQV